MDINQVREALSKYNSEDVDDYIKNMFSDGDVIELNKEQVIGDFIDYLDK